MDRYEVGTAVARQVRRIALSLFEMARRRRRIRGARLHDPARVHGEPLRAPPALRRHPADEEPGARVSGPRQPRPLRGARGGRRPSPTSRRGGRPRSSRSSSSRSGASRSGDWRGRAGGLDPAAVCAPPTPCSRPASCARPTPRARRSRWCRPRPACSCSRRCRAGPTPRCATRSAARCSWSSSTRRGSTARPGSSSPARRRATSWCARSRRRWSATTRCATASRRTTRCAPTSRSILGRASAALRVARQAPETADAEAVLARHAAGGRGRRCGPRRCRCRGRAPGPGTAARRPPAPRPPSRRPRPSGRRSAPSRRRRPAGGRPLPREDTQPPLPAARRLAAHGAARLQRLRGPGADRAPADGGRGPHDRRRLRERGQGVREAGRAAPRVASFHVRLAVAMACYPRTAKLAEREFYEAARLEPTTPTSTTSGASTTR